jgi:oxygen-independent coproporphyrinogen-3 oxidase
MQENLFKKEEETQVGNYFVSNYPPFSYWQREQMDGVKEVLNQVNGGNTPLGLYFHIPFCRKRCHFCYFKVYTDKNAQEIKAYIDAGMRELEVYSKQPYLQGRKVDFVYFGGGTPSYLPVPQLRDMATRMKEYFPWDEAREIAFEAEPGTLSDVKLAGIREIGVTRLSLGVEHFDDGILESNGRAHREGEVYKAYEAARKLGFEHVNIDLIAGMMNDDDTKWSRAVEKAIELAPDAVTLYQMEVPYNTTIYQQMKTEGKLTAPVASWETKRRWVNEAFSAFERAGYTVTSAYTAVKNPQTVKFIYRDELWEGADLLACGVASFGHLNGVHYQNQAEIGSYMQQVNSGHLPIYRAYALAAKEKWVREFLLKMKLGSFEYQYYMNKFNVNVEAEYALELESLVKEGFAVRKTGGMVLTRNGLLQVDRLLHRFFLPEHQQYQRYT